MKIQFLSDIHLEWNTHIDFDQVIEPIAPILCLAGDIGNPFHPSYYKFLEKCHNHFKYTLLIPGNHEYIESQSATMEEVDTFLTKMCQMLGNVYYLPHGGHQCIDDINFIGATLWSYIDHNVFPSAYIQALDTHFNKQRMNSHQNWNINHHNRLFNHHVHAINYWVRWGYVNGKKNVVITHHSPIIDGPFKGKNIPTDYLYGTDLSHRLNGKYIKAWIYGHTHHNYTDYVNNVLVTSNQFGRSQAKNWCKTSFIDI